MVIIGILLAWLLMATMTIIWRHGATLQALWLEPVVRRPILIFESDDWGPGEATHAQRLRQLAETLAKFSDAGGSHPIVTLGMVMAIPDRRRMQEQDGRQYAALTLADERFAEMRDVIREGVRQGVMAVQLHGMEHYWPPALMAAAKKDEAVASWLNNEFPRTEGLPAPLQSRWIDASVLPSQTHAQEQIEPAVKEEVGFFMRVFAGGPSVVVPPTFVWSRDVERAWAQNGVRAIVTPGRRFEGRDARGKLISSSMTIRNGMRTAEGLVYMVRDDYFEPAKGHRAERAWAALEVKTRCGRPTLLEMHRFNFVDDPALAERSYQELARVVEGALQRYPSLVFMSTEALVGAMAEKQASLIASGMLARVQAWCWRVRQEALVWRAARFTGLALLILLLQRCVAASARAPQVRV